MTNSPNIVHILVEDPKDTEDVMALFADILEYTHESADFDEDTEYLDVDATWRTEVRLKDQRRMFREMAHYGLLHQRYLKMLNPIFAKYQDKHPALIDAIESVKKIFTYAHRVGKRFVYFRNRSELEGFIAMVEANIRKFQGEDRQYYIKFIGEIQGFLRISPKEPWEES